MKPSLKPAPNAALVLADGTVFLGYGIGAAGTTAGELCFNTAMTGYQEILTDPSYSGQIITFTAPHIGNVGCNDDDHESPLPGAAGLILREAITAPSSFRSTSSLDAWLAARGITGISGIDTRALTRHIRLHGAQNCAIMAASRQSPMTSDMLVEKARAALEAAPDMNGLELAAHATTKEIYEWKQPRWSLAAESASARSVSEPFAVVAIDYGLKHNILRSLVSAGCRVTVVPATATAEEILALNPEGVFLSNGPGDPAATANYAVPTIKKLIATKLPIFGICLGHQMLGIALGCRTEKMKQGHRGANHPVKDLTTGKVEITSQNHGFAIADAGLSAEVEVTHRSLFDGTIQGIRHKALPIFSVQGHPEASPGPHDSQYLFTRFTDMMQQHTKEAA
jgi:carbamoyl-phosphate synthase small subunit